MRIPDGIPGLRETLVELPCGMLVAQQRMEAQYKGVEGRL